MKPRRRKPAPSWADQPHDPLYSAKPKFQQKIRKGTMKVIQLSTIEPEPVHWLWYPYIAHGFLTNFGGDPGVGKSFITCNIAARLSRGERLPGQTHDPRPQNVLMLSAEDPARQVLVPRLLGMHADLQRIYIPEKQFQLNEEGLEMLREAMAASAATIVFIDPLTAYVGGKVDLYRDNEMRAMFGPMNDIAEKTGTALIVVQHLAKDANRKDIYKFSGSVANIGAVRSGLLAEKLDEGGRVFRQVKNNLGPEGSAWRYEIVDGIFEWGERLEPGWKPVEISKTPKRIEEIRSWLISELNQGPVPAREILERAKAAGWSTSTLNLAKKNLVVSLKEPGVGGQWLWALGDRQDNKGEVHQNA